ncbi:MAG TPA: type II toxin-antitoxin system VapC family toxin [Firmicutes bacterium]|nr:type II toxin-antitoxin system VapC family toxin [Bacillota bacterium]
MLDTTVLIDISRGNQQVTDWLLSLIDGEEDVATSVIVIAEYISGIPPDKKDRAKEYLSAFDILPITFEDATCAGGIRWEYARKGTMLALADALHGAIAMRKGLTVATSNPRHFPFVTTFDPRQS